MLLALDLASRLTGWCAGTGAAVPHCGAWEFPRVVDEEGAADYGLLLATLESFLEVALTRFRPTAVCYEAPILITGRRDGDDRAYADTLHKLRLLYPMGAFVEYVCHKAQVPCFEVSVQDIKREVTGHRHADKAALVAVAQALGLELPKVGAEDAADAFGAWLLLLRAEHPVIYRSTWDSRVRQAGGSLL